jgi:CRP-like cAMP-binding protein
MVATIEQLRGVPLFAGLPDKALTQVLALAKEVDHESGKPILEEDHSGVGFHLILEGNATVDVSGTEVARFGPGDYFGEMSIIDGLPRSATVTAAVDVRTLAITSWDFEGLMEQHPSMMRAMLVELSGRIRQIEKTRS